MNPLIDTRRIDLSATQKRTKIARGLNREPIKSDTKFVALMNELSMRDKNLDAVIEHLNAYRSSVNGCGQALAQYQSVRTGGWNKPIKVELTLKHEVRKLILEQKYQDFIIRLSKECYGKTCYRRHKKRVLNHFNIEGGTGTNNRIHIHTIIETPNHIDVEDMKDTIRSLWWKYGMTKFAAMGDTDKDKKQVAGYNTKLRTKSSNNVSSAIQDSFGI
jgi:hypothetical protein